jgi:hypothetical protein
MHQVDRGVSCCGREIQLQASVFSLCSVRKAEGNTMDPALVSYHRAYLRLSSHTDSALSASHRLGQHVVP